MTELSEQSTKLGINKLKSAFPPVYSIILGILASAICGFMLAKTFFYESRILILVFYTILFGFLSGTSIFYGVKRNKYKEKLTIFFLIMLCSFLTYLIFSFSFIVIFGLPRNYPISFYLERIIRKWPLEYNKIGESYLAIYPVMHIKTSTPSATFPPAYYKKISSQILQKRIEWVKELGLEPGTKKTVDWLYNKLPEEPLPGSIAEAFAGASLYSAPGSMDFTLTNNFRYIIYGEGSPYSDTRIFVPFANITILLTMFSITIYCAWIYIIITCPWLSSEGTTGWFQPIIKKLQRRFN